jgi:hypothetical protein
MQAQTRVQKSENGYSLLRDGKPYYIKGVGGEGNMKKMIEIGSNSIRTWGVENAQEILDEAQKNGITVMLGLWMNQERQGFDYDNKEKVQKQFEYYKTIIEKYKNHPALLMWGIGNELDLDYKNPNAWNAVQDIAEYIHQSDPNHPTTTVIAGLDSMDEQYIKQRCKDVEILCINTYGDIGNVSKNIKRFGWDGPYMITEWGPRGYWEAPLTNWKVSIEQTSTEKRKLYYEQYQKYIGSNKDYCLGSYAFYWGFKQEYTETWFGLFSKENVPTEAIDALEENFTEKKVANPAPSLVSLSIDGMQSTDNVQLNCDETYKATVDVSNNDEKDIQHFQYKWRILEESTDKKSGGDAEEEAQEIQGLIKRGSNKNSIQFYTPSRGGNYRLFVTIKNNGKVAYTNIPFQVMCSLETRGSGQKKAVKMKFTDMNDFEK